MSSLRRRPKTAGAGFTAPNRAPARPAAHASGHEPDLRARLYAQREEVARRAKAYFEAIATANALNNMVTKSAWKAPFPVDQHVVMVNADI